MTAVESMQHELKSIQESMNECVTEAGFVKSDQKYRYQLLVRKAKAFKEAIEWMISLKRYA